MFVKLIQRRRHQSQQTPNLAFLSVPVSMETGSRNVCSQRCWEVYFKFIVLQSAALSRFRKIVFYLKYIIWVCTSTLQEVFFFSTFRVKHNSRYQSTFPKLCLVKFVSQKWCSVNSEQILGGIFYSDQKREQRTHRSVRSEGGFPVSFRTLTTFRLVRASEEVKDIWREQLIIM